MTGFLRALLLLCPAPFRRAYGAEIVELFERRHQRLLEARASRFARARLWLSTSTDIVRTAAAEWRDRIAGDRRTPEDLVAAQEKRISMIDRLSQDLREAGRRLAATPGFAVTATLILAIGIGGTAAIFSAVDAFVLRPRPFAHPQELVNIYQHSDDGRPSSNSYPAYLDARAMTDLFAGVGAVMPEGSATLLTPSGEAQPVQVEYASASYFPVLGLRPARGRWFADDEDRIGGPVVAVVGYQAWQRRFGADPAIVGRTLRLSGASVTIVGVGPRDFGSFIPGLATDFWLSISSLGPVGGSFRARTLTRREDHWFQAVARLKPGRTVDDARTAMQGLAARLDREFPETDRGRGISVASVADVRVHPAIDGQIYPTAGLFLTLAGLVLVVVCSNLATLVLARGAGRRREFAVRLALGATRLQIVRALMTESLVLAAAGGVGGLLVATWLVGLLGSIQWPVPLAVNTAIEMNARVLAFGLALTVVTSLAFGLGPALRNTRRDVGTTLKGGRESRTSASSWRRPGARGLLVTVQVAVSLALLAAGGILLRSTLQASRIDLGFDAGNIAVMTIDAGQAGLRGAAGEAVIESLRARAASYPGVQHAALATRIPLTPFGPSNTIVLDETARDTGGGDRTVEVEAASITSGFFDALRLPILRGRAFNDADRDGSEPVAIVSAAMARAYWGTIEVVGRRYRYENRPGSWVRIAGVSTDAPVESPGEAPRPFAYRPFAQDGSTRATLVLRTAGDSSAALRSMRDEVRALDPRIPVSQAGTMVEHVNRSLAVPRAAMRLLVGFGVMAIALACFGVYSVVAFSVSRRTREMGVRMAVGATASQVTRLVLRQMLLQVGAGIAIGLGLAALLTPALGSLLVGVRPVDPVTFGAVAFLVLGLSIAAAWIPARQAGRGDLTAVLRAE